MNLDQQLYFRDSLREARTAVLDDSEGFNVILLLLERLGRFLNDGRPQGLAKYKEAIVQQAARSPLAHSIPEQWPECHINISALYDQFRAARNDAVHEGALARHYTAHGVILAIVLEDGFMAELDQVGHFMVRTPICAEMWQPLSFIRQTLLANSFSYMPVNTGTVDAPVWNLVSDIGVATFLRGVTATTRAKNLALSLQETVQCGGVTLIKPFTCFPDTPVSEVLSECRGVPVLVVARGTESRLLGMSTAFDLL